MTPAQARAFLAVATEGSFTAAARRLHVSQPTITNQVGQIEARYKVELFHRSGRGVSLTGAGAALLPSVRRMFANFEEAVGHLEDFRGLRAGQARVGSYGANDVTLLVASYRRRFPSIAVSIDIANSNSLAEKLLRYDLDVALLDRMDHHPEFQVLPFRDFASDRHSAENAAVDRPAIDFGRGYEGEHLDLPGAGSATRAAFDRLFARFGIPAHRIIQAGSREAVVSVVSHGAGLAAISTKGRCRQTALSS